MPSQDQQIIQFGPYRNKDISTQIDSALSTATVDINGVATKIETANTESQREFSNHLIPDEIPQIIDGGEINFTLKQNVGFSYVFDLPGISTSDLISGILPNGLSKTDNKNSGNAQFFTQISGYPAQANPNVVSVVIIIKNTAVGTKYKLNFIILDSTSAEEVTDDGQPKPKDVKPTISGGNGGDGTVNSSNPGSGGTPSYDYWKPKYFTINGGLPYKLTYTTQSWEKVIYGVHYFLVLNMQGTWSYTNPADEGTTGWDTNGKFAIVETSSISGYNTTTGKIPNGATLNKPVNSGYSPQSNFITFGTTDPHSFSLRVILVDSAYDFSLDSFGSPVEFSLITDYVDYSRITPGSSAGNNSYIVGAFTALVHS